MTLPAVKLTAYLRIPTPLPDDPFFPTYNWTPIGHKRRTIPQTVDHKAQYVGVFFAVFISRRCGNTGEV